jgi:two-component system chemotaxis sensor kinase CheA
MIDLRQRLEAPAEHSARFALIVNAAGQRAGLLLDRLVGKQEIVIKPLDDDYTHGVPFSGATIQDTGHVSLILDVGRLVRQGGTASAGNQQPQAA